jgi:hypothetical protein
MQTFYQKAEHLETVKNTVTASVLNRLWSDYHTFVQKTFEAHYPGAEWPSVETIDQQRPGLIHQSTRKALNASIQSPLNAAYQMRKGG